MIRAAQLSDLSQIWHIYQSVTLDRSRMDDPAYQYQLQKNGFLLGQDTRVDLQRLIIEADLFLVSVDGDQLNGYIIADKSDTFQDDEYKTWFDETVKDIYFNSPSIMCIHTLAVNPDSNHTGVASQLLAEFEQQLKLKGITHLFSIITLGPLTNCASLLFHTKRGSKRLAVSRPRRMFELDHYASVLLYKQL